MVRPAVDLTQLGKGKGKKKKKEGSGKSRQRCRVLTCDKQSSTFWRAPNLTHTYRQAGEGWLFVISLVEMHVLARPLE